MQDVEGQRGEEAQEERDCYPLVTGTDGEHFWGYRPGNSEGVELLDCKIKKSAIASFRLILELRHII